MFAGCTGDGEGTTVEETITPSASMTTVEETDPPAPSATAVEGPTPTSSGTAVEEMIACEHPDGYAMTYPADWHTYPDDEDPELGHHACSIFGTAPMELEAATSMPWLPIRVWVWDGLPFEDATSPELRSGEAPSRDLETQETTIAGQPAMRIVSVSDAPQDAPRSDYYLPAGTETVDWIVDLSTDTADRVLLGRAIPPAAAFTGVSEADTSAEGATSVDSTAEVLDAMMASLSLTR